MISGWTLALLMGISGCLGTNNLRPAPPDRATTPTGAPCPVYPKGGGGGLGRPMVPVPAGTSAIRGVSFPVASFSLDVFQVTVGGYRDCVSAKVCTKPASGGGA